MGGSVTRSRRSSCRALRCAPLLRLLCCAALAVAPAVCVLLLCVGVAVVLTPGALMHPCVFQ